MVRSQLSKLTAGADDVGRPFRTAEVQNAIDTGIKFVRSQQREDGSWGERKLPPQQATGQAVCALLECGVSPKDERLARALDWLAGQDMNATADLAMRCQAFAQAVRKGQSKYRDQLAKDVALVVSSACGDGGYQWNCTGRSRGQGNTLATAWAQVAVAAGADAKVPAPMSFWTNTQAYWFKAQRSDGGWSESAGGDHPSSPIQTVPALAGVYACLKYSGRTGSPLEVAPVKKGLDYLDKNFLAISDDSSHESFTAERYNYIYFLARLGILSGRREFGGYDWYRTFCNTLVQSQSENGSWEGRVQTIPAAAGSLMFLGSGLPGNYGPYTPPASMPASRPASRPAPPPRPSAD